DERPAEMRFVDKYKVPPTRAGGTNERDRTTQFKIERTGKRASFAEVAREPRDSAAAGSYTSIEVDQVESDVSPDRVDRLPNRLEISRLAKYGSKLLILPVVAAEIPYPPVINVGQVKLPTHVPHYNNIIAVQNRTPGQARYSVSLRAHATISARPSSSPVQGA